MMHLSVWDAGLTNPAMFFGKKNGHVPRDHLLEVLTGGTPFCTKLPVKSAIDVNKPSAAICQPK